MTGLGLAASRLEEAIGLMTSRALLSIPRILGRRDIELGICVCMLLSSPIRAIYTALSIKVGLTMTHQAGSCVRLISRVVRRAPDRLAPFSHVTGLIHLHHIPCTPPLCPLIYRIGSYQLL